jgi:hypothetical protein
MNTERPPFAKDSEGAGVIGRYLRIELALLAGFRRISLRRALEP